MAWINRSLECLWLTAVVLVPLIAVSQGYLVSERLIAFVELPKIVLLRSLVALMATLWLIEWGLTGRLAFIHLSPRGIADLSLSRVLSGSIGWFRSQATRWLYLAVGLYLATTALTTVLSASFEVSLWGEVPGQDGYPVYTIVGYVLLFAIISTHLKTRSQLCRLLGAIVLVGVLVGVYGVLQGYGHDVFNLAGPGSRITSTMGNPILAGAVLLITLGVSLMMSVHGLCASSGLGRVIWRLSFWSAVLIIQMWAFVLTFSRGPWAGTVLGLATFLILVAIFLGRPTLARTSLVLVVSGFITVLLLGLSISPPAVFASDAGPETQGRNNTVHQVSEPYARGQAKRLTSIGGLSGRLQIWKGSWQLITRRPWVEFEGLELSYLRPFIGFGPELFRYVYLLESPGEGEFLLPLDVVHAHNPFLHQWVEQGLLGLISAVGLLLAPFVVGGYQLLHRRQCSSFTYQLLLIGLLAILSGRLLEQMVGLARVSDLTLYWVLLAAFAVLPKIYAESQPLSPSAGRIPSPSVQDALERHRFRVMGRAFPSQALVSGVIIASLIIGISWVTWFKSINYVLAGRDAAIGHALFSQGDYQASLEAMARAAGLAPDVYAYRNYQATILSLYAVRRNESRPARELECSTGQAVTQLAYEACLVNQAYRTVLQGVDQRPLNYLSRAALADLAFRMSMLTNDRDAGMNALRLYGEVVELVPNSWPHRNQQAEAYLGLGQPNAALQVLEQSLAITGETGNSSDALLVQGEAYLAMGELKKAIGSVELSLELGGLDSRSRRNLPGDAGLYQGFLHNWLSTTWHRPILARLDTDGQERRAHDLLVKAYLNLGKPDLAEKHLPRD